MNGSSSSSSSSCGTCQAVWTGNQWIVQTTNYNCSPGYQGPSQQQLYNQLGAGSSSSQTATVNCVPKPNPQPPKA